MKPRSRRNQPQPTLLPTILADVDLVRIEKNLLQIGYFSAEDPRKQKSSTRRIELTLPRDNQRIKVFAEFRGSDLGLPTTSDRDKFLALMKLVSEDRQRYGKVQNPIRFTGYRLLSELGLTDSGANYVEILKWGQRMTDTSITSEKTVYFTGRKSYADKTIHVFRSFKRMGASDLDEKNRCEYYEVELEDWLIENLNNSYVIPEDFRAYKLLTRPTAKGIFGNLHLWFHASKLPYIEKNYVELCSFLAVRAYPHASKIRETMGPSLDELVKIKYLATWNIQPMASKAGFKIVMFAGEELLRVLAITGSKKQLPDSSEKQLEKPVEQTEAQKATLEALVKQGIAPAKAKSLAEQYDPELVLDQIEFAVSQINSDSKRKFYSPTGFIIYTIENALPVPPYFVTTRMQKQAEEKQKRESAQAETQWNHKQTYEQWKNQKIDEEIQARFPREELDMTLKEIVSTRVRLDNRFKGFSDKARRETAMQFLRKDIAGDLMLPTYQEWGAQNPVGLF